MCQPKMNTDGNKFEVNPLVARIKHQAPTSKLQRNSNHQSLKKQTRLFWMLKFGGSLDVGAWDLELSPLLRFARDLELIEKGVVLFAVSIEDGEAFNFTGTSEFSPWQFCKIF